MTNKGKLIEHVYNADLSQRATLVIFYLINRADQENTCFPGIKTIAKECNISTRTVQRALNDLEKAGFITRESRFHEQGGQRSNLYHLIEVETTNNMNSLDSEIGCETYEEKDMLFDCEQSINIEDGWTCTQVNLENNRKIQLNNSSIELVNFNSLCVSIANEKLLSGTLCHDGVP
jgi:predicted transcriptional regulator